MKILFIFYQYPLHPQGSYFQEFLNKVAEKVDQVYLLASHYPKGRFKKSKNLTIFWLPFVKLPFIGEFLFILRALLKTIFTKALYQVDLVNSIGLRGVLAGWYLKKRFGIPLVCTIELLNEGREWRNRVVYFLSRFLLTRAPIDKYICWSDYYWKRHLKRWGISKEKVVIIPAGIDVRAYHPKISGEKIKRKYAFDSPLIVFAKPLYLNHPNTSAAKILVEAVALLGPKLEARLLIGSGEGQREIQNLAHNLGVASQVDFMPKVPFPKIPQYLAAADLIVLPFTYASTTARSLLEAMAMGKPIITTPIGEIKYMLKNEFHALLVKNQPKEIAEAMTTLIEDKNLAKKLGRNARHLALKRYSLDKIVQETISCFFLGYKKSLK